MGWWKVGGVLSGWVARQCLLTAVGGLLSILSSLAKPNTSPTVRLQCTRMAPAHPQVQSVTI